MTKQAEGIITLDFKNPEHRRAAAFLHKTLMPDSLVSRMGRLFMSEFYYRKLVQDGLIQCDLYCHQDRMVGLSAYTPYPYTFMERGRKRHFFYLALIAVWSVLSNPSRLGVLWEVLRQTHGRGCLVEDGSTGEYLTLGALPDAADLIDAASGLRAPHALLARAVDFFRKRGYHEILLVIKKTNFLAFRFYERYGAVEKRSSHVPASCRLMSLALES